MCNKSNFTLWKTVLKLDKATSNNKTVTLSVYSEKITIGAHFLQLVNCERSLYPMWCLEILWQNK